MNEELRFKNTLLEYEHEIQYCEEVLASGATGDDRKHAQLRLEEAEKNKKKLLKDKDKLLKKKVVYVEPAEYIPEHIRRELKLGEFAEPKEKQAKFC